MNQHLAITAPPGTRTWFRQLKIVLAIAEKDARIYFFKGPNLTFGLLMPVVLYAAYALERAVELRVVMPGLVATALLFGAGAIQGVALPLERRTGTLHLLLTAPVTPFMLMLSKTLAGAFFGMALALLYASVLSVMGAIEVAVVPFVLAALACSFCFSAFGLVLAIPFHDIPQAMPPATVIRIALVFVSGTFSADGVASPLLRGIAHAMPMIYGVHGLRQTVNGMADVNAFVMNMGLLALFTALFLGVATWLLRAQLR